MIALKRVLVATDFGPESDSALRYAQALARGFGGELHVLHVVENVLTRAGDGYGYAGLSPEVQWDIEDAGRKRTQALVSDEDRREMRAGGNRDQQQSRDRDRRLRPQKRHRSHRHGHARPRRDRALLHGKCR